MRKFQRITDKVRHDLAEAAHITYIGRWQIRLNADKQVNIFISR